MPQRHVRLRSQVPVHHVMHAINIQWEQNRAHFPKDYLLQQLGPYVQARVVLHSKRLVPPEI